MKKIFCALLVICIIIALPPIQLHTNEHLPLQGRVIILDAGHGLGADNIFAGYSEQRRMLLLAHKIQAELTERGATVLLTRETEENVSLSVRVALMNKWSLEAIRDVRKAELAALPASLPDYVYLAESGTLQAEIAELNRLLYIIRKIINDPARYAPIYMNVPFDMTYTRRIHPDWQRVFEMQSDPLIRNNFLAISLHSNATAVPIDTGANGADIFISTNCNPLNINYFANYSHEDITYKFADMLLDGIHQLGIRRREITPYHWMIIRETNLPALLVENGFHTNPRDRTNLLNNMFLAQLATVYADTIEAYFSIISPPVPAPVTYIPEPQAPTTPSIPPFEGTIFTGSAMQLTRSVELYTNIGDSTPVSMLFPQYVRILDMSDDWIQIDTWLGPKWIRGN